MIITIVAMQQQIQNFTLKKLNIRIETNLMYYYNCPLRGFQILNKQVHITEKYMYGRYFFKI